MNRAKIQLNSWVRRNYLINRPFQIRFILYSIGIALLAVFAVYLTANYFFWSFQEKGREIGLSEGHVFFAFIEQQRAYMNQLLLGLSFFFVFGLTFWGLILSHRVCGPLFRLHKHMWCVAKGEAIPPLAFRDKDFFQELSTAYNAQYEYLRYGVEAKNDSSDQLDESNSKQPPSNQEAS
ncbi:MAG: HAMP domain-containing protein [Oligoflexus sp.]